MSEFKNSYNLVWIKNIQKFLNKFQKVSRKLQIDDNDSLILNPESQLPDLYLKTRMPIDRNKMFFMTDLKCKGSRKSKTYGKNQESNLFPLYFLLI